MMGTSIRKIYLYLFWLEVVLHIFLHKSYKMCEAHGLDKDYLHAYHIHHINNVMVISLTGYLFESSIDNGGDGLKVGLIQFQFVRISQRDVQELESTLEG